MQSLADVEPTKSKTFPAVHKEQLDEPEELAKDPGEQSIHDNESVNKEYFPSSQLSQDEFE
jgi:hypothetical protein